MGSNNPTVRINIEPHLANIDKEVAKYENKLKDLQNKAQDMGFGDNLVKDIDECIQKLNTLREEYSENVKKLANNKIDTEAFDDFARTVDSRMDEVSERMSEMEESISSFSKTIENIDASNLSKMIDGVKRSFRNFKKDTKDAVNALKEFQEFINIKHNTSDLQELDKTISKLSKINLDTNKNNITSKNVAQLKDELVESGDKVDELQQKLATEKNPVQIKKLQKELVNAMSYTAQLAKRIDELSGGKKGIIDSSVTFQRDGTKYAIKDFAEDIESLQDSESILSKSLANTRSKLVKTMEDLGETAQAKVASFTFEDGGIQVPVVLSQEAMSKCRDSLEELINNLSAISEDNPVDVTLRLFPLKTDKSEQAEVSKYINNVRAQIPELPEGELKDSVTNFMDKFEKEYQKALVLKIKVLLSEDAADVEKKVKAIQKAVRKVPIEINPQFVVTDKETKKLNKQLAEVSKDFSLDFVDRITKMSEALEKLLSTTDVKTWSDAFTSGLSEIESKLSGMKTLIEPLYELMSSSEGKRKRGRPSNEDIANRTYVEKFTIAIESLNNALNAYKNLSSKTANKSGSDIITDVQDSVNKSGKSVQIPIEPVIDGFVSKIQNAIGGVPIDIEVGNVDASNATTQTKSKGKSKTTSKSSNKTTQKETESTETKQQGLNISQKEIDKTNAFNFALSRYVELMKKIRSSKSDGQANFAENQMMIYAKQYPELASLKDYPSALDREYLLTNYLKREGIERTTRFKPEAQWEALQNRVNQKRPNYKDLVDKYINYQDNGGRKEITELTNNKTKQKALSNWYNKLADSIREKNKAEKESASSSKTDKETSKVKAQTEEVKKNTSETKKNTEAKKSNKTPEDYKAEIEAVSKANAKVEENTEKTEENTKAKKSNKTPENYKAEIAEVSKANAKVEENTEKVKENTKAKKENNTIDVSDVDVPDIDLSDNFHTDEQLAALDKFVDKEIGTSNKSSNDIYSKIKSQIAGLQAKGLVDLTDLGERQISDMISDIEYAIKEGRITIDEAVENIKTQIANFQKSKNLPEPSFVDNDNTLGEAIKEIDNWDEVNLSDTKSKAKAQAKEVGEAVAEGAKEGTKDAQQSNSPSKVAEALGGDWGTGYANGILKTEAEVKAAVKQLVESGTLTAKEVIDDLSNIKADEKYKDLVTPVADYKKDYKNANTQVKGVITKLNNADNLSTEQLDKYTATYTKWINKLKELGVDVSKLQDDYSSARSKFGQSIEERIGTVDEEIKVDIENVEEKRKKYYELLKSIGRAYLNTEEVDLMQQSRIDKNGNTLRSYKVSGATGSVTLNPRGEVITDRMPISDDYTKAQVEEKRVAKVIEENEKANKAELDALTKKYDKMEAEEAKAEANEQKRIARVMAENEKANKAEIDSLTDKYDKMEAEEAKAEEAEKKRIANTIAENEKADKAEIDSLVSKYDKMEAEEAKAEAAEEKRIAKVMAENEKANQAEINALTDKYDKIEAEEAKAEAAEQKRIAATIAENEKANQKEINALTSKYDQIDLDNQKKAYDELESKVKEYINLRKQIAKGQALDGDIDRVKDLEKEIVNLNVKLKSSDLFNGELEIKATKGLDTIDEEVARIENNIAKRNQAQLSKTYENLQTRLSSSDYDIGFEIDNGKHTAEFIDRLNIIRERIDEIRNKKLDVVSQSDINQAQALLEDIRQIRKEGNLTANKTANENSVQKSLAQINSMLSDNTKLSFRRTSVYRDLVDLQNTFKSFDTSRPQSELAELTTKLLTTKAKFEELDNAVKGANLFQTFIERLHGTTAQLVAQYLSFQDIIRYARSLITTLIDLDTQLVDLRKTTSMSTSELEDFYNTSSKVAKQLGVTSSEIISQAAAWSRLGYSSKEAATTMAQLSSQFASISPGMDTESATDSLVSTMQAYKIGVEDVKRSVMDNINAIGNSMATTNEEIGEMLQRSSAAMKAANNSLEETIALEAAAVEITRNAETTGTAYRTISMRIRGYDEETEELSDDLENISGDIADLTKTAKNAPISIFTDSTRTEYKSTYQILKEISEIWDNLTDKQQADLLEKLGGKRGAQSLAGILADFSSVEEAMATMENAAGSADREMGIIRDSLEFKINALKQTWVGILTEITDRGELGNIVDNLTRISEALGTVVSNLGLVKTAVLGVSAVVGATKVNLFNYNDKNDLGGLNGLTSMFRNQNKLLLNESGNKSFMEQVETSWSNLNTREDIEGMAQGYDNVNQGLINYVVNAKSAGVASDELTDGFIKQGSVLSKLESVGGKVLATIANMGVSMLASFVVTSVIQEIQNLINSYDDLAKKANEIGGQFQSSKSELDDFGKKAAELQTIMTDSSSTTEEVADATAQLYEIQNNLISTYGAYHEGIDLVNGDLESQLEILQEINKQNAQKAVDEINSNRSAISSGWNILGNLAESATATGLTGGIANFPAQLRGLSKYYENLKSGDNFIEAFKNTWTESDNFGYDLGLAKAKSSVEQITDAYENFNAKIRATDNSAINEMIDSMEEFSVNNGMIEVSGSVDDVSDAVVRLQTQLRSLGYQDEKLDGQLTKIANDAQDIIDSSSEAYQTILYNDIQNNENEGLLEYYDQLTQKYNEFKDAQKEGDTEAVDKAKAEYIEIFSSAYGDDSIEDKYINYFEKLYPELQAEINKWELDIKVKSSLDPNSPIYEELQKLQDWGLSDYEDQITSGELSQFGNIDMNNRAIIEWTDQLKEAYKFALQSWDYDPTEGMIDTVFGGTNSFSYLGEEHEIAFSPILQTENGPVFLDRDNVYAYINDVISKAAEDGIISADEILQIDATGTGYQVGDDYVHGLIAAIDNSSGIAAEKVGMLMHFAGEEGAYNLAKQESNGYETLSSDLKRNSADEIWTRYNYFKQTENSGMVNQSVIDEFHALEEAAAKAGMGVEEYIRAVKNIPEFSDEMQNLRDLMGENWDEEFASELSESDLTALINLEPKEDGLAYTKEEIEDYLNPISVEVELEPNASDLVKDLDTLEDKWGSLSTAYESSVTNGETISATDLQSVTDDFGGIGKDSETGNYNALSSALEKYNEELVENPGDTTVAQNATDRLATAYLDLTGTLEDLIDEDAEYAEEILKANGVENAHEVVTSRLGKVYKGTRKNLEDLAEAVAQWSDNLDDTDQNSQHFLDGLDGIRDSVSNLIALYDENGEVIASSVPELDNSFLIDNLEDIKLATEGDVEALDRLYVALARVNAEQVYVDAGLDTSDFSSDLAEIESLVAYANTLDIENDAYINDSQFMATLQKLLSSSSETASAVEAALSSIGIKISYKTTPKKIKVATDGSGSHVSTVYGGANAGKTVSWDYVDVDEFEVVATKTGSTGTSGTGVKNYSGGSSSSSSGGSGGDSGGSDDTSTDEETFDWVEVKIDRLEEQLARLDEAIDDVYDNWGNRNDAISEKIKTVTDEIETQKDASKRYLEEANKYADLIGKEYVEKVQNGEIDIETIKVETSGDDDSNTLIENIQEYQTWYEKYIEASDQVNTLSRELNSYYKDLFDNVESEYEDLLDEIEKKTSIIEERITRTEEHGFFVDEAYYTALKSLEEENFNKLEKEREELITKLNNAVTTGKIKKGSEAWYEMYLAIQDVNKAIEESMTNTVKLNNEIRQLKWDKFDWVEERMDDFAEEADFLIKLLQGEETIDDRGYFNDRGYANAALVGAKYDDALAEAQRYKTEIAKIDEELATEEGKYDKNLIERKEELVSAYRDAIEAAEDEKQAMKSLVEEAVKQHLDYLSKLINKYKDALSTMKSTYEYAKNINDQTKNISNLEKQLAAYQGDTSEEARKKRQELQNQLDSAQQQLEETQWDKYISETGEMLDNLYDNYETYLNDKLSNVTELMSSMIDMINQGTYTVPGAVTLGMNSIIAQLSGEGSITTAVKDTTISIQTGMDEIRDEYDLITQKFEDFGNTANGTKDILSAWSNGKYTNESTFVSKLDDVKTEFSKITNGAADTIKNAILSKSKDITVNDNGTVSATDTYKKNNGNGGGSGNGGDDDKRPDGIDNSMHITDVLEWGDRGWYQREGMWHYRKDDGSDITSEWYQDEDSGWWYYFDPGGVMAQDQFVEGYWLDDDGHMMPDKFQWHGDDSSGWWFGTEDGSQYVKGESVYIDGKWYDFDDNGWMKYASGSRSIPTNRLAWTQDEGQELIYRTTDGALLTPLNQGDMVFTNEMSQRLWEIASGQIPIGGNIEVPIIGGGTTAGNVTANNNITIELPNVENYDDFKKAMKQDRDLEKFWQEITIGQMMGNARLKKNKY